MLVARKNNRVWRKFYLGQLRVIRRSYNSGRTINHYLNQREIPFNNISAATTLLHFWLFSEELGRNLPHFNDSRRHDWQ